MKSKKSVNQDQAEIERAQLLFSFRFAYEENQLLAMQEQQAIISEHTAILDEMQEMFKGAAVPTKRPKQDEPEGGLFMEIFRLKTTEERKRFTRRLVYQTTLALRELGHRAVIDLR